MATRNSKYVLPVGRSEFNYFEFSGCPENYTASEKERDWPTVREDQCHDARSGSEVYDKRHD